MRRGFSIIEMIMCIMFSSLIILSLITLFITLNDCFEQNFYNNKSTQNIIMIDNTFNEYLSKKYNNVFVKKDCIYIDNKIVCSFEKNKLVFFDNSASIQMIELDFFEIVYCNEHLFKIVVKENYKTFERYYYIGGILKNDT